jgi:hypothetical protein
MNRPINEGTMCDIVSLGLATFPLSQAALAIHVFVDNNKNKSEMTCTVSETVL